MLSLLRRKFGNDFFRAIAASSNCSLGVSGRELGAATVDAYASVVILLWLGMRAVTGRCGCGGIPCINTGSVTDLCGDAGRCLSALEIVDTRLW